jgi:hypothetical protein
LTPARNAEFLRRMSNVLGEDKQHQVVALGRLGWSLRRIEEATGVRRETVSSYLKAVGIVVRGRGRRRESKPKPAISPEVSTDSSAANPAISEPVSTDSASAKPATRAEVSTDLAPVLRPGRAPSASACEPYRELIAEALGRGRNAMAIWQDLVDDHGFIGRYASVRRFVVTLRGASSPEARVVITTAPGEEGQVDYGDGPMVRYPPTGKYRRTRLFVLTLGYSRKAVRLLVWQSGTQVWAELHERAFRRLGGTVRVIVLDNLKEGGPHPGHLRAGTQSAVSRRARPLRRRRASVSRWRSRSQGQSRSGRRPREANAAAWAALRIARRGAGVP